MSHLHADESVHVGPHWRATGCPGTAPGPPQPAPCSDRSGSQCSPTQWWRHTQPWLRAPTGKTPRAPSICDWSHKPSAAKGLQLQSIRLRQTRGVLRLRLMLCDPAWLAGFLACVLFARLLLPLTVLPGPQPRRVELHTLPPPKLLRAPCFLQLLLELPYLSCSWVVTSFRRWSERQTLHRGALLPSSLLDPFLGPMTA